MKKGKFILYLLIGGLLLCFLVSAMGVKVPGSDQIKDGIDNIKDKVEDFIDDVIKPGDDEDDDGDKYIQTHWKFRDDITLSEVTVYLEDGNSTDIPLTFTTTELIGHTDGESTGEFDFSSIEIDLVTDVVDSPSSCSFIANTDRGSSHLLLSYDNASAGFSVNANHYNKDFTFCILEKPTAQAVKFLKTFCEQVSYNGSSWVFDEATLVGSSFAFVRTYGEKLGDNNYRFVIESAAMLTADNNDSLSGDLKFIIEATGTSSSDATITIKAERTLESGEVENAILAYGAGGQADDDGVCRMHSYLSNYVITLNEEPSSDMLRFIYSFNEASE